MSIEWTVLTLLRSASSGRTLNRPVPASGSEVDDVHRAVLGEGDEPEDSVRAVLWNAAQQAHQRIHRVKDGLGYCYAVILLTQAEHEGQLCYPPDIDLCKLSLRPYWLDVGTGFAAFGGDKLLYDPARSNRPGSILQNVLGKPLADAEWSSGLGWNARRHDPSAGVAPSTYRQPTVSNVGGSTGNTYQQMDYADYRAVPERPGDGFSATHFGGTLLSFQGVPQLSEFYLGLREGLGGFNFGLGVAWLDIAELSFDWHC